MERLIFKEEQSFRQSFVPWLMLATLLFMTGGFVFSFYQQLYLGNVSANAASDKELIWGSIISFVVMSVVFLFILSRKLITEIWTDGIRYRFSPFVRKIKHIPFNEIVSAEVARYKPIIEFGGWGVRKRILSRKTAYNISGNIGLRVKMKNGSQVVFGTRKENEMRRAVEKMMQCGTDKFAM